MRQRGRKSAAALAVRSFQSTAYGPAIDLGRPDPPARLTAEEARQWREIVKRMPADWFALAPFLLEVYCRHCSLAGRIDKLIEATDLRTNPARFGRLLRMQRAQSQAIMTLATKLRLTPLSRYDGTAAKRNMSAPLSAPWEAV
jgi:hypothetical protein